MTRFALATGGFGAQAVLGLQILVTRTMSLPPALAPAAPARAEVGVGERAGGLDGQRRDAGLVDDGKEDAAGHVEDRNRGSRG